MRGQSLFRSIPAKKLLSAVKKPRSHAPRRGPFLFFSSRAKRSLPLSEYYARATLHNFSNPLSICLSIAQDLKAKVPAEEYAYLEESLRTMQLILKSLQRKPDPLSEVFTINTILDKAVYLARYRGHQQGVRIFMQPFSRIQVAGPPAILLQILLNVLQNSLEALESPEIEEKNIFVCLLSTPTKIIIEIQDTGPGILDDIHQVFEPFYSLKPHHEGIGISYVRESLREYFHGSIAISNLANSGTLTQITLPASSPPKGITF